MRKRTVKYTEGEIGRFKVIKNFLPPPDKLVLRKAAKRSAASERPKRDYASGKRIRVDK